MEPEHTAESPTVERRYSTCTPFSVERHRDACVTPLGTEYYAKAIKLFEDVEDQ